MPDLLGVTNPVPGHENANINRNMPVIPNDPRLQNATDPTRVSRGDNRTERQDAGDAAGSGRALRYDSNFAAFLQRLADSPDMAASMTELMRAYQGTVVSSGMGEGIAVEMSALLEMLKMDEGEFTQFFQSQMDMGSRFSGPLFSILREAYSVDGLTTAKGSFDWALDDGRLGWAGVGQDRDLVNPCALMVYMGAVANGGRAAEPYLILKTKNGLGLPSLPRWTKKTAALIDQGTAEKLAELMAGNVEKTYGQSRFPNMDLCGKSGTAEVGEGKSPHAWFAGFLRNEDAPYAFVALVENGGGGSSVAGGVAGKVLDVIVNGYEK